MPAGYSSAQNLGVLRWGVWSAGEPGSILDECVDPNVRCLVVDLGSLGTREEQALVAEGVLGRLWERRTDRTPVLIVIDEAHNVCPQEAEDSLTALATEHAVRIAGGGRKFGLYLLVSTQRPQKVHENVLSHATISFMRMNSTADLGFVGDVFSSSRAACSSGQRPFARASRSRRARSRRTRPLNASVRASARRAGATSPPTGRQTS